MTSTQWERLARSSEEDATSYEEYVQKHQSKYLLSIWPKHAAWIKDRYRRDQNTLELSKDPVSLLVTQLEPSFTDEDGAYEKLVRLSPEESTSEALRNALSTLGDAPLTYIITGSEQPAEELIESFGATHANIGFTPSRTIYLGSQQLIPGLTSFEVPTLVKCAAGKAWSARALRDIELATRLLVSLGYKEESLKQVTSERSNAQKLDTLVTHLRLHHHICFYCGFEAACREELVQRCGQVHLRGNISDDQIVIEQRAFNNETNLHDKRVTKLIHTLAVSLPPITLDEFLEAHHMLTLDASRFGCRHCTKLFKAPEFVVKHLQSKHPELEHVLKEELCYLNRMLARPRELLPFGMHPRKVADAPAKAFPQSKFKMPTLLGKRKLRQYVDLDAPQGLPAAATSTISYEEQDTMNQ